MQLTVSLAGLETGPEMRIEGPPETSESSLSSLAVIARSSASVGNPLVVSSWLFCPDVGASVATVIASPKMVFCLEGSIVVRRLDPRDPKVAMVVSKSPSS